MKKKNPKIDAAIEELKQHTKPVMLSDIARKYGVNYQSLHARVSKHHPDLIRYRDKRSWRKKIKDYIKTEGTCMIWTGPHTRSLNQHMRFSSPRQAVAKLLGLNYYGYAHTPNCNNPKCVNPQHYPDTAYIKNEKAAEIVRRWKLCIQHFVTLAGLAKEFGITKQRVHQIVTAAGLSGKLIRRKAKDAG